MKTRSNWEGKKKTSSFRLLSWTRALVYSRWAAFVYGELTGAIFTLCENVHEYVLCVCVCSLGGWGRAVAKRMNFTDDVSAVMRALWPQRAQGEAEKPTRSGCVASAAARTSKNLCDKNGSKPWLESLFRLIFLRRSSIFFPQFHTHSRVCRPLDCWYSRFISTVFFPLLSLSLPPLDCVCAHGLTSFLCDDFARCSTRIFLISARRRPALVRSYQKSSYFYAYKSELK